MSNINTIVGILLSILIGHVIFLLTTGFGALLAFIWVNLPNWVIVVGSLFGSAAFLMDLLRKDKGVLDESSK